jgi:hypothetical protein
MKKYQRISHTEFTFQHLKAEKVFKEFIQKTEQELIDAGCTITQGIHDERIVTLPGGVTDFSEIEKRIWGWLKS